MSMPEFELPDARTPSRKSGTPCILRLQAASGLAPGNCTSDDGAVFYLVRYAHATDSPAPSRRAAPPRSHAAAPRPHAATRWDATQGRAAAPAPRQAAGGQAAGRAEAPGLA